MKKTKSKNGILRTAFQNFVIEIKTKRLDRDDCDLLEAKQRKIECKTKKLEAKVRKLQSKSKKIEYRIKKLKKTAR
ncbi:MAG: hypothetical protein J6I55_00820 [Ruminococcus sp.]|nr:hypothetical protein [Ruminococcus sp.]HAE52306.1 hypothetical protein [Ruminococcus sp.]